MLKLGACYTFICSRFVYWGKLEAISDDGYWLTNAYIIYETGPWKDPRWQSYEKLPTGWYLPKLTVESVGVGKSHLSDLAGFPAASAGVTASKQEQETHGSPSGHGQDDNR